jgi:hypothetical protein
MKTEQDMSSSSTGFHLVEIPTATALKTGTFVLLLVGACLGAYLMWRMLKRRTAAQEQMRRQLGMEMRSSLDMRAGMVTELEARVGEPGPEMRGLQALPGAATDRAVRRQSLGFVPGA